MPFMVGDDAIGRIREPDGAIALDDDVIGRVQAAALIAADQQFVGTICPAVPKTCAQNGPKAVRAVQQRTVSFASMTIDETDPFAPHALALIGMPTQHAIIRNVAPQYAAVLMQPDRSFAPGSPCGQPREGFAVACQRFRARIKDGYARHHLRNSYSVVLRTWSICALIAATAASGSCLFIASTMRRCWA